MVLGPHLGFIGAGIAIGAVLGDLVVRRIVDMVIGSTVDGRVCVGEVVLGDGALGVGDKLLGEVGIEPFLCGDPLTGGVEVDAAEPGCVPCAFGLVTGDLGVEAPRGADVVGELQIGDDRLQRRSTACGSVSGSPELVGLDRIWFGVGAGGPDRGVGAGTAQGVVGDFEFVGDVAGCEVLLPLPCSDKGAQASFRHVLLVGAGGGQLQRAVSGAEDGVFLGQAGGWGSPERVLLVDVVGPFAVARRPSGLVLPGRPAGRILGNVGYGAQRLTCPLRWGLRQLRTEVDAARIGGVGERLEPRPVLLGDVARDQVGEAGHLRVELSVQRGADAEVQHLRHRRRPVQRRRRDGVAEHLGGVVAGELGGAQELVERGAGLVGGEREPMVFG